MKFYTSHQIALHSAIADHGFTKPDFSFTKKRGRITANHNSSDATFTFIERRVSRLNVEEMRVMDQFSYALVINEERKVIVANWDMLVERFNNWLIDLKKS